MSHFPNKNYFTMPNEIFSLGLDASEIAVYAYLRCLESRSTYQCWPSYTTSGSQRRTTADIPTLECSWIELTAASSVRLRSCWRPHGCSTTWAISSGTTLRLPLPLAFKSTASGCRSFSVSASPLATSRTIMNSNRRDILCSSVDSLNAKGATRRAYFALPKSIKPFQKRTAVTKEDARKSNSFPQGFVVCVVATKKGVIPYG